MIAILSLLKDCPVKTVRGSNFIITMPTDMRRLVIVSNRLPISVKRTGNGTDWTFQLSSGGLVSALQGLQKTTKFQWIGWPGKQ